MSSASLLLLDRRDRHGLAHAKPSHCQAARGVILGVRVRLSRRPASKPRRDRELDGDGDVTSSFSTIVMLRTDGGAMDDTHKDSKQVR